MLILFSIHKRSESILAMPLSWSVTRKIVTSPYNNFIRVAFQLRGRPPAANSRASGTLPSIQSEPCVGSRPMLLSLYNPIARPPSCKPINARRGMIMSTSLSARRENTWAEPMIALIGCISAVTVIPMLKICTEFPDIHIINANMPRFFTGDPAISHAFFCFSFESASTRLPFMQLSSSESAFAIKLYGAGRPCPFSSPKSSFHLFAIFCISLCSG
mmetsp:Transcript_17444/g.37970  ORF Transcript_17444/g.37970 Transcript_17444/m.37970 type:complete len:216 (-) Transcript_17444:97-744(-)